MLNESVEKKNWIFFRTNFILLRCFLTTLTASQNMATTKEKLMKTNMAFVFQVPTLSLGKRQSVAAKYLKLMLRNIND